MITRDVPIIWHKIKGIWVKILSKGEGVQRVFPKEFPIDLMTHQKDFHQQMKRLSTKNQSIFNKRNGAVRAKTFPIKDISFYQKSTIQTKSLFFSYFYNLYFFFYSVNWRWYFCSTFVPKCDYSWWKITNSSQRALEHFSKTSKTICCQKKPFSW